MPELVINLRVAGASQIASQISPAGTAVQQLGQKAGGAVGPLNNIGTAAQNAGTKAATAGGKFAGMGQRIAGVVGGIGLLAGGLFGLDNAFDAVEKADYRAGRASKTSKEATEKRVKAEQELAEAMGGGLTVMRNSNGEVHVQVKSTEDLAKLKDNLADATEAEALAIENEKIKVEEATEAHSQLFTQIMPNVAMMAAGASNMVAFGRGAGGVATGATQAASGLGAMSKSGSGIPMMLAKIALPIGAAVGAFFLLKNNVGGSRDALNAFGEAVGKAVPALKPVLNIFKGIGEALGIQAGPGISRIMDNFNLLKQQLTPFANTVKQKLGEAGESFKTFLGQLSQGDISGAFGTLKASAMALGGDIMGAIKSVNWAQVWQGLQDAFKSSIDWIRTTASNIGSAIAATVKNWNWGDAWKSLQDAFNSSIKFLVDNVGPILTGVGSAISNAIGPIIVTIGKWINSVDWVGVGKWITDHITGVVAAITAWVNKVDWTGVGKWITDHITGVAATITAWFNSVDWAGVGKWITDHITGVIATITAWVNKVDWAGVSKWITDHITGIVATIAAWANSVDWPGVGKWITNQITGVVATITAWANQVDWAGTGKWISDQIKGVVATIAGWSSSVNWGQVALDIQNAIGTVWAQVNAALGTINYQQIRDNITNGIGTVWAIILAELGDIDWTGMKNDIKDKISGFGKFIIDVGFPAADTMVGGWFTEIAAGLRTGSAQLAQAISGGIDFQALQGGLNQKFAEVGKGGGGAAAGGAKQGLAQGSPTIATGLMDLQGSFFTVFRNLGLGAAVAFYNSFKSGISTIPGIGPLLESTLPKIKLTMVPNTNELKVEVTQLGQKLPDVDLLTSLIAPTKPPDTSSTPPADIKTKPKVGEDWGTQITNGLLALGDFLFGARPEVTQQSMQNLQTQFHNATFTVKVTPQISQTSYSSGGGSTGGYRYVPPRPGPSGSNIPGYITSFQHGFGPTVIRKPMLFRAGEQGEEYVHIANRQQMSKWGRMSQGGQADNRMMRELIQLIRTLMMRGNDINVASILNVDGYKMATNSSRQLGNRMYGERF